MNGADRDRTGDPLVANQVLSQLSYRPKAPRSLQVSSFPERAQVGCAVKISQWLCPSRWWYCAPHRP
jgi:hypothetical protein